ncbi:MAG: hypothetical protein Q9167_000036 [Letrouitia subvulpina]
MELGQSIPPDTAHAVSVCLPTWQDCVGYEEGDTHVVSKMSNGYPRFFIDKQITSFVDAILLKHGEPGEGAILFPSHAVAIRCVSFFRAQLTAEELGPYLRLLDFFPRATANTPSDYKKEVHAVPMLSAVIYLAKHAQVAKAFWQHSGEGVSSRRAELCHKAFQDGYLHGRCTEGEVSTAIEAAVVQKPCKGPRRYQREASAKSNGDILGAQSGNISLPSQGKLDGDEFTQFVEERYGRNLDLSLAKTAKSAIRRRIAGALTGEVQSLQGSEYLQHTRQTSDTQGCSEEDVYLYPSGMSSIFNTHRNLTASRGALKSICFGLILNARSKYYWDLKKTLDSEYEDNYWAEDAIFMERNSRDFIQRAKRINKTAEAICRTLETSTSVKEVYYPLTSSTRPFYDACRSPDGGYGGLISVTFETATQAKAFYNSLKTAKGPSLGTNFTLSCPYTLLAHYTELEWAAQFGVDANLVRMSVGLEDTKDLCERVERALAAVKDGIDRNIRV